MAQGPDVAEIEQIIAAAEAREAHSTDVERFDSDHQVLLNVQGEVAELLTSESPDSSDNESLRALLERIENAIDTNRSKRAAAAHGVV
jgi:Spy/CpxP family protein refolding chaperone